MWAGVWGDKGGVGGDEEGRALAVAVYGHGVAEDRCGGESATRYMVWTKTIRDGAW